MRNANVRWVFDGRAPAIRILLGLSLLGCLAGCGGGGDKPETYPATGVVTYNGTPLEGATVVFHSSGMDGGRPGTGVTNEAGEFSIRMFGEEGALPGDYKVTVAIVPPIPDDTTDESAYELPTGDEESPIPARYGDITQTPFTATVSEGGDNNFTFELED